MIENTLLKGEKYIKCALHGIVQAFPVMLGYLPVGFAYGVLAQKAGISNFNTLLMSIIVYAGSAQLIAVGLVSIGMPSISIVLTTFVINLRHMLMSAALSPYLHNWRKVELAGFAFELTDESFALHAVGLPHGVNKAESFAINIASQSAWVLGSWLGISVGRAITEIGPLALDYALPAMFIALLVMQIKSNKHVIVAVLSGGLSIVFIWLGFNQWHVIIATVIGATIGVLVEKWMKV